MGFKKWRPQTLQEYIFRYLSNEQRLSYMQGFSRWGDPNEILNELLRIPPCWQNEDHEFRINQNYLLWWVKEHWYTNPKLYIWRMEKIQNCYLAICGGSSGNCVGLVFSDGNNYELSTLKEPEAMVVYNTLLRYVRGFSQITPEPGMNWQQEVVFPIYKWRSCVLRGNCIFFREEGFRGKITEKIQIPNLQDVIWCEQRIFSNGEDDTYYVRLYAVNQRKPIDIELPSVYKGYKLIVECKKRVPHLLYGSNGEYQRIFERNPYELMAIAKGMR